MKKVKILVVLAIVSIGISSCHKDGFLGVFSSEKPQAPNTNVTPSWEAVNDNVELLDKNLEKMLKKAGK